MRKVIISENQAKFLEDAISASDKRDSKYYPLNDMRFAKKMNDAGYEDIVSCFSDDITSVPTDRILNKFNKILSICKKREEANKDKLYKICYNTILDLFNVPEDEITIDMKLSDVNVGNHSFNVTPVIMDDFEYYSISDMDMEDAEVEKRKILNMIVQGAALDLTDKAIKSYLNDIFEIDEELPHLYSKLIKLNRYLLYTMDFEIKEDNVMQGGCVDVYLGNDIKKSRINVMAECFPVMLSECIKGMLEIVISNALPDDLDEAKAVIAKSDILIQDPINMTIGLPLWKHILNGNDVDSKAVPEILRNLCDLDTESFMRLFKEIVNNTRRGKEYVNDLISYSQYNIRYNNFLGDLEKKRDITKGMIEDDLYSDEERF